jgi:alpha-beta hydrolase superfamily lysophospholipase
MRHNILFILLAAWLAAVAGYAALDVAAPSPASASATYYRPDTLGGDFVCHTFHMADDYEGQVVSTLVSLRDTALTSHRAVLYVHGFNDYFFQSQMAARFDSAGFNFYAVDLRKYGRSLLPEQYPFNVRSLDEYFADIDSALTVVRREGNTEIVLMGHSTGGLITSMYAERHREHPGFDALVLNSPFLDMNQGWFREKVLIPVVAFFGRWWPDVKLPQGLSTGYAESLLAEHHGKWSFNTDWKRPVSPPLTLGWIRAIYKAQVEVRRGLHIGVPVLVLHSDKSVWGDAWTPDFNRADAVLDVDDIERYGRTLGPDVTTAAITGGMHDLVLSAPAARAQTYATIFAWLKAKGLE